MLHAEYQAFTHWLYQHHGWAAFFTFIIAALESLIIVGTIIPGSITMTAVGIMMGTGVMSIPLTIGLASAGAFVGDGISYIIGYRFRETLPQKWPFRNRSILLIRAGENSAVCQAVVDHHWRQ